MIAFLGFEYLVTFDREVELFWKRKFTGASVLFLLNRYLPLLTVILDLSQSTPMSDRVSLSQPGPILSSVYCTD